MKEIQYQQAIFQFVSDYSEKHGTDLKCTFVYSSKNNLLSRIAARYKGYATSNPKELEIKAKREKELFERLLKDNELRSKYMNPNIHNVYGRLVLVLNRWSEKQLKRRLNK